VVVLRHVLRHTASRFDEAFGAALFHRSASSRARSTTESLGHAERMNALHEIRDAYDRAAQDGAEAFFAAPAVITPREERVRRLPGGEVVDWYWPSGFALTAPHRAELADKYLRHEANHTAAARVWLHGDRPRPVVMLLHGYRAGQWSVEERAWPLEWLFERGLDIALPVLPFHAVRAPATGAPIFPGSDPRVTNEGFRQTVLDLRTLAAHLRTRGAPQVGVMGMSLGGYSASLLATVDEGLSFLVPMIPLASLADMARRIGRFTGSPEEQRQQHAALDAAHRSVSPLARAPKIAGERVLVLAAEGDRITPPEHARRLGEHFRAPVYGFPGGHILQFGRRGAFREVGRMLGRLGVLDA
jgi:pimeloyl-ACP methyl ester carboxylesterase